MPYFDYIELCKEQSSHGICDFNRSFTYNIDPNAKSRNSSMVIVDDLGYQ